MLITGDGQLNITTEQKTKEQMLEAANTVASYIAKEQAKKGEIRLEMNFTPLLAHRYIQKQMNDLCKAVWADKNLNEQFRAEFASLQSFKFFTEDQLSNIDQNMRQNHEMLTKINNQLGGQKAKIDHFQELNMDVENTLTMIDKKLKNQRNLFDKELLKQQKDLTSTQVRLKRAEVELAQAILK